MQSGIVGAFVIVAPTWTQPDASTPSTSDATRRVTNTQAWRASDRGAKARPARRRRFSLRSIQPVPRLGMLGRRAATLRDSPERPGNRLRGPRRKFHPASRVSASHQISRHRPTAARIEAARNTSRNNTEAGRSSSNTEMDSRDTRMALRRRTRRRSVCSNGDGIRPLRHSNVHHSHGHRPGDGIRLLRRFLGPRRRDHPPKPPLALQQ
jgi:hypothetical protein